jgi:fatty-acid desaturase
VNVRKISLWIPMLATLSILILIAAPLMLQSFVRFCAWDTLSLESKPLLANYLAIIVFIETTWFKESFRRWKFSLLLLLRMFTYPRLLKIILLFHRQLAHKSFETYFHMWIEVYSSTLQLLTQPFNMRSIFFFCLSSTNV